MAVQGLPLSAKEVFERASRSVVVVHALDRGGDAISQGSGVVISKNAVATNCHVIEGAASLAVRQVSASGDEAYRMEAEILARNDERDLCLLSVAELSTPPAAPPARIGAAKSLQVGEDVFAIGTPQGLELSLSRGIVAQLRTVADSDAPLIQTDAAISPGSSGGGLFNDKAELVGITTLKYKEGESLNFAIPVEWIGDFGSAAQDGAEPAADDDALYQLYRLLAEAGVAEAQIALGWAYANGRGVPRDIAEAVRWFRRAAEQGVANAQYALGAMYDNGQGVVQDDAEAVRWYRMAAEQGFAEAQYNLGNMYANGRGVVRDDAEAVRWFRMAAEQGDAQAQFNLGVMYANGRGVVRDDAEAVRWWRMAAEQGGAEAQNNLGFMYANGEGVMRDDAEAVRWYRMAAEQGDANAQFNLGYMYGNGRGVVQDYAEAVRWYRMAAEQGDANAQFNLGYMYGNGRGVVQDYAEAVRWHRMAAERGVAEAQFILGVMYSNGQGVPQNYREAYIWFSLAAVKGVDKAAEYRDDDARQLSPYELSAAQKEAAQRYARIQNRTVE